MNQNLRDMALFVDIARAGTLSKASVLSKVPISTLSRRLAAFEARLGFQLVRRNTRKLTLTDLGQAYFEECSRVVAEAEAVHERLLMRGNQVEGELRLSMTPDFGALVFAPLLIEFAVAHPLVTFELDLTPHFFDIAGSDIDIAIRFGEPADSRLTMRRLGTVEHWLCASPAYIARHGMPASGADLAQHPGIMIRRANDPPPFVMSRGSEQFELKTAERFGSNHPSMLLALALADLGIAVLPDVMARRAVDDGRLVRVMGDWRSSSVPVLAITRSRMQPARCRLFLEFLAERASSVLVGY